MSTMYDQDEQACRGEKIGQRGLILDAKITLAQGGTRLYHRRFEKPFLEDVEIGNNHIKQSCIPKIMKDLRNNSKKLFDKYILLEEHEDILENRKLRYSQKYAVVWKKFQRTRCT